MSQPTLFADPLWTDPYHVGQQVHDGISSGVVTAILDDCPGGLGGLGLTVRYPDGAERTFGYDHMISVGGDGSSAPIRAAPQLLPGDGLSSSAPQSAPAESRNRASSETGPTRMSATTAVPTEEAPAQRYLPGA